MKGVAWILTIALATLAQRQTPVEDHRSAALALEQQGANAAAESEWRALLKAHPANAEAYAHLGLLEARQEHYKDAVPLYRKALQLDPRGTGVDGVRLNLGLAQFKSGELKGALETFDLLLKRRSASSAERQRLVILIGMAHYGLREYAAAIPYLREAAAHDATNLPLRLTLAHSCLWSKQAQCVMEVYHEILSLNAESAEADMLAGEALDEEKDTAGATKQFRAAVSANPREPNVHFGLGYLLWEQKLYDDAIPEFKTELDADPKHGQAMTYLGDSYMRQGKFADAKEVLGKAAALQPAEPLIPLDLANVSEEMGDKEAAVEQYKSAIALEGDNVTAHFRLAKLLQSMGRRDEAKVEFAKARSLNLKTDEGLYKRIEAARTGPPRVGTEPVGSDGAATPTPQ